MVPRIDVEKAIAWVERKLCIKLAAGQPEAIRQACHHKMLVITAGPGVGKITLVHSIPEIFAAKTRKCALAAPTGRAAKRLAETAERTAKIVHRILEFDPATAEFKRNQQNPLEGDFFVLDEVSMVEERIPTRFGFDPKTDIQVLSPMNRTLLGTRNLDQVPQTALNPGDGGPEVQRLGWTFGIGDLVVQAENDYDRDVFKATWGLSGRSTGSSRRWCWTSRGGGGSTTSVTWTS
jgi:ATP-dependent exoDNAse (exonuclease V) alpha subunit